jgi:hypothetical protein
MTRRAATVVAVVVVVAAPIALAQLGWVRVGSVSRNSYEMFRSAQRLGLGHLTPMRVAWYLVPVASLAIGLTLALGRRRLAAGLLALQGAVVGATGSAVLVAEVAAGIGAMLAPIAALAAVAVAIGLAREGGDS